MYLMFTNWLSVNGLHSFQFFDIYIYLVRHLNIFHIYMRKCKTINYIYMALCKYFWYGKCIYQIPLTITLF
jgi:hypothetical protein